MSTEPRPSERRAVWEQRWSEQRAEDMAWHLAEAPPELPKLLDEAALPAGAALDLGCGNGVAAAYLATRFPVAVGIDIAHAAVAKARRGAAERGVHPRFSVADASVLPFRTDSFAFVFDRGCLQNLPRDRWPAYWAEVERLLASGGVLQLFCSKAARAFPPLASRKGLKARAKWLLGRRAGPQFLSAELIRGLVPPGLRVETLEELPYRTTRGGLREMVYGVFRRA
jgi:SAM-dependent methyltransferase